MANIDKIIEEILDEARKAAVQKTDAAKAEASDIISNAEEECRKLEAEIAAKTEQEKKNASDRAKSSAQLKKRQMILNARQEVISDILDKAYDSIFALDDKAYFRLLEKMLKKFSLAKDGEICFSKKDLERMPADFENIIVSAAKENGGSLKISKESRAIDGGFILVYGGVEENCSIRAMFHTQREYLADKVQEILFS